MVRILLGFVVLAAGGLWLGQAVGWRQGVLWLLGAALGFVLFQARFGFTGGFRALLLERRSAGVRAQLLLIGLLVLAFLPLIEAGLGRGYVFPVGLALLLGAFLFGVGMQLGGGCGSGTLYAVGGGVPRMGLTLAAFIGGATLAAWGSEAWEGWPALPAVSLPGLLGTPGAMAASLAALGLAWWGAAALERRRHRAVAPLGGTGHPLRGPWPLLWGALGLAVLSVATLLVAGRPWAITAAFPLWGSHAVAATGWDDPSFWPYWEDPTRVEAWLRPVWADRIGVMDVGLMLGAFIAAGLAGRGGWRLPRLGEVAASLLGGVLLGVGAMLASGCNISAYVAGIASGSLHGWVWIWPALLGNWVGARLRRVFRLE